MSDLESFTGFDSQGDAMDPGAFERFKERMKAAAAQLKAQQAGEQKQKKTEDELVKILLKFIQSGQQKDILLLVIRLLEENVPAFFIVSILVISNPLIQQELGLTMLPPPSDNPQNVQGQNSTRNQLQNPADSHSLIEQALPESSFPPHIKLAINIWLQHIYTKAAEHPHKVLKTTLDEKGVLKLTVLQLATFCLRDFFKQQNVEADYAKLKDFISLMLNGIIKKLEETIKDQKELPEA